MGWRPHVTRLGSRLSTGWRRRWAPRGGGQGCPPPARCRAQRPPGTRRGSRASWPRQAPPLPHVRRVLKLPRPQVRGHPALHWDAVLVKPKLLMNVNGKCLAAVLRGEGVSPEAALLVHDDLERAFGKCVPRTPTAGHGRCAHARAAGCRGSTAALPTGTTACARVWTRFAQMPCCGCVWASGGDPPAPLPAAPRCQRRLASPADRAQVVRHVLAEFAAAERPRLEDAVLEPAAQMLQDALCRG